MKVKPFPLSTHECINFLSQTSLEWTTFIMKFIDLVLLDLENHLEQLNRWRLVIQFRMINGRVEKITFESNHSRRILTKSFFSLLVSLTCFIEIMHARYASDKVFGPHKKWKHEKWWMMNDKETHFSSTRRNNISPCSESTKQIKTDDVNI